MQAPPSHPDYDVLIVGGALAGAATALLLLRHEPQLRVAIIEKSERFGRRVGEATVEISGYFLSKVLHLTQHLNEAHLHKQGMRFWFHNERTQSLTDCSEIGGRYLARLPAWQVDRAVLDEEVLRRAVAAGAKLLRPAKVTRVHLNSGGEQVVEFSCGEDRGRHSARWVVDGSGFTALLARQEGWYRRNEAHPTTAVWTRWRGVTDLDGDELATRFPEWFTACHGIRSTATNHLVGDGWWAWVIPLKGGDYSIGVVFDHRRVSFPEGASITDRLRQFLVKHPVGALLLQSATALEGDAHWRNHLPYWSERQAGDGFVLVGDSAGFLDPFYSPGMDWLSYTVTRAVELIQQARAGGSVEALAASHEADFRQSQERWFRALYLDKYDTLGDFELMRVAFELDLGLYFLGVVSQPLKRGAVALRQPVFTGRYSEMPYRIIAFYNRRLACIGRERRAQGTFGRQNDRQRYFVNGFIPDGMTVRRVLKAALRFLWLELSEGRRTWFSEPTPHPKEGSASQPPTGGAVASRVA